MRRQQVTERLVTFVLKGAVVKGVGVGVDSQFDQPRYSESEVVVQIVREAFSFEQKIQDSLPSRLREVPVVGGLEEMLLVSSEGGVEDIVKFGKIWMES